MVAYGAEISDEQSEIITTYLTKNYGKADLKAGRVDVARPRR
jgi:hypothetical protein